MRGLSSSNGDWSVSKTFNTMDENPKLNSDLPGAKWDNDKSPADGILVEIDHGPG